MQVVYVMYYFTIITSVMMPHGDPGETNRLCLRAGCYSWYQSFTGVIHHVRPYFWKHTVRKHIDAHIRTIVVLTGGKLIVFKLCNYVKKVWCDFWDCFELFCCLWNLFCCWWVLVELLGPRAFIFLMMPYFLVCE
jgi:hypothetical protein